MSTIEQYSTSNGGVMTSTSVKIYTQEEYEEMLEAGTWTGGNVEGLGYVLGEVIVEGSLSSSEFEGSEDSWNDPFDSGDDFEGEDEEPNGAGGGNTGGNTGGNNGGGNGTGNTGGNTGGTGTTESTYPTPSPNIPNGAGVRIYSERFLVTSKSTLSRFSVAVYDENGNIVNGISLQGYFLERVLDYDKAEVAGSNTAIKRGEYLIEHGSDSNKYDWYLTDVPGRTGIAIHNGNYYYQSQGCLIIGESYRYNSSSDAYVVYKSKSWLSHLTSILDQYGNGNIVILITESF